ncbi:MAG: hypothetical protein B6242_16745 [Anaerolineaceae bacterium 4572_78]|nr:MAG: hypothetical protein B6242_16745 [Anaerolineaceae bacterium 4572_78]
MFIDFYANFDRILLSDNSIWFGGKMRDDIYKQTAAHALDVQPRKWKEVQKIGNRATIHQGQIYRSGGRDTTFMPSFRTVTDMDKEEYFSVLAGGPSDRRFSKWYCSDLDNWIAGRYKLITPDPNQTKYSFK